MKYLKFLGVLALVAVTAFSLVLAISFSNDVSNEKNEYSELKKTFDSQVSRNQDLMKENNQLKKENSELKNNNKKLSKTVDLLTVDKEINEEQNKDENTTTDTVNKTNNDSTNKHNNNISNKRNYNSNKDVSNNSNDHTEDYVYANGGRSTSNKYHSSAHAHGMEGAIKMTREEAEANGYVACQRCY